MAFRKRKLFTYDNGDKVVMNLNKEKTLSLTDVTTNNMFIMIETEEGNKKGTFIHLEVEDLREKVDLINANKYDIMEELNITKPNDSLLHFIIKVV